jgi:hypothetical protein
MWQDGLALFIVVIAALTLLRIYVPAEIFRFGARRGSDSLVKNAVPADGCGSCTAGSSCSKTQIKVHPVILQRRK